MTVRVFAADVSTDLTILTTTETVVATLSGVSTNQAGQTLTFEGSISITTGTGTTGLVFKVRKNDINGAVVGEQLSDTINAAAGSDETHLINVQDTSGNEFSGGTFVLTAQQTAATANGNIKHASLRVSVTP